MKSFDEFWQAFPRRVGKIAAEKAYEKTLRQGYEHEDIMAGVEAYKRTKPEYADWCHPTTWLNQGRWMDEPDAPKRQMREVSADEYRQYLRELGRHQIADTGPNHPAWGRQRVPADWERPALRVVELAHD